MKCMCNILRHLFHTKQMKIVYASVILALIGCVAGNVSITSDSTTNIIVGTRVKLSCRITPLTNSMNWEIVIGTALTTCLRSSDMCIPATSPDGKYAYTSDISIGTFYLEILSFAETDATTFTCSHAATPPEQASIRLTVKVPIVSVTLTTPTQNAITVLERTQITFICDTSESSPRSIMLWYKDQNTVTTTDDQEITTVVSTSDVTVNSETITRGTLRYTPSRQDNGWSVFCRASNGGQFITSRKCRLTVHYPPTIISISDKSIVAGQSFSQTCVVSSGNPTAYTYRWTRSAGSLSQSQNTLSLPTVQTSDAATYTCRVQNTMLPTGQAQQTGEDTKSFVLDVLSPPTTPTFRYKSQAVSGTTFSFIYNTPSDYLRCESTGNPLPNYRWRRPDGSIIFNNREITLTTIPKDQGGVYSCTSYNTLSPSYGSGGGDKSSTTTITLNILYPPPTPSLTHDTTFGPSIPSNSLKVVRGDNVNVACSAYSNPGSRYQWSVQSGDSQILTINNILSDTIRTCTATTSMQPTNSGSISRSASTTVTISVMYPPTKPTLHYNYWSGTMTLAGPLLMIKGDSGTVLCSGSTSKPAPDAYTWYSNSGLSATGATLNINNVVKDQAGIQICRVTNTMYRTFGDSTTGEYNKRLTVTVLYPPFISPIFPKRVNEGSLLSVPCATTAGNPPQTTYKWTRSGDSLNQASQNLTISQNSRTDSRVYTCKAQNTMVPTKPGGQQQGVDTKTVQVTVEYAPDVTVTTTNTTVNANNVDIVCSLSGVPSTYTYQPWTQHWIPDVEIIHTPGLGNNPTLQLTQLSYLHSGVYTCTAGNGVLASNKPGAGSGSVYLLVKSQPIVTEPTYNNGDHHKLSIPLNTQSSLVLKYYSNAGDTTVTVNSKIGGNIGANVFIVGASTQTNVQLQVFYQTVTAQGMTTTVTFTIREQQQFGQYEIVLRNDNDLPDTLFIVDVTPKQPPEVPYHMTSANVTQSTAELTWIRGFHGGSDQTFVVQLSRDNIQWTNKTFVDDGQKDRNTTVNVTMDGLIPGTTYHVRVFAFNQEGHNDEYSNVHDFNTEIVPVETIEQTSPLGGVIGGTIAGVVVIVLVVVAIVLARRYDVNLACKCTCKKKMANPDTTQDSKTYYENVRENKVANTQGSAASEQVSYYNIGRESEEPVPSTYETISDREPTPNMYSSIQNIEMATTRNIASDPAVSEPIQSQYESLTDREAAPNMYSSLDNIDSSPGGNVASNPGHVYYNLKV